MSKIKAKDALNIAVLSEGLSRTAFAELIDITISQACNIVNKKGCTSPKTAKKIADKLGKKVSDLFEFI